MVEVKVQTNYGIDSALLHRDMRLLLLAGLLFSGIACVQENKPGAFPPVRNHSSSANVACSDIGSIPAPEGFMRRRVADSSFAAWLRRMPLKQDRTVYLYNGQKKKNQQAQYAVIDMPVGERDLQQCADAVMRLRAEYLFAQKKIPIVFTDYENRSYNWNGGNRQEFESYLANVFGWCGSASLEKQMERAEDFAALQPGDVLVRGGFPGHAVIVVDMAENEKGEKMYMLAQGYMPAQDIHVLVNPLDADRGPWYLLTEAEKIYTPEWTFSKSQLRRW